MNRGTYMKVLTFIFGTVLFLSSQAYAEQLSTGPMKFGPNCFGLGFSKPKHIENRLDFRGQSAVGSALMSISVSEQIDLTLKGAKISAVKTRVEEKDGFHHLHVSYLHDEGVCIFDFPLYGFSAESVVAKNQAPDLNGASTSQIQKKIDAVNEFKLLCEEIGFTPNTESFGNCVLRLLKD